MLAHLHTGADRNSRRHSLHGCGKTVQRTARSAGPWCTRTAWWRCARAALRRPPAAYGGTACTVARQHSVKHNTCSVAAHYAHHAIIRNQTSMVVWLRIAAPTQLPVVLPPGAASGQGSSLLCCRLFPTLLRPLCAQPVPEITGLGPNDNMTTHMTTTQTGQERTSGCHRCRRYR